MIKQYEGNNIYKIHFISTGRDLELSESELREISDYMPDLEDKYELIKLKLDYSQRKVEELLKTLKEKEGLL